MDHYRPDEHPRHLRGRQRSCIPGVVWLLGNAIALAALIVLLWP